MLLGNMDFTCCYYSVFRLANEANERGAVNFGGAIEKYVE